MLIKIALIAVIIAALIAIARVNEGFQTTPTLVKVYFKINSAGVPTFISSDNPNVTFVSSSVQGGTAVLNVDPSLGVLSGFSGCGYRQTGGWGAISPGKLDKGANSLQARANIGTSSKVLHNVIYKPLPSATSVSERMLPQELPDKQLNLIGLVNATFGVGTSVDTTRNNATILVKLLFNAGTSTVAFPALAPC